MNPKVKNALIAVFVVACIGAYVYDKAQEAKDHSPGAYQQYQNEYIAEKNREEEEARINQLYDMACYYEDVVTDINDYLGSDIKVYGEIAEISQSPDSTGSPTFIDLGEPYPSANRFTIVIWEEYYSLFSDKLQQLNYGDTIFVDGCISTYEGVPQIEVTDPAQIQIL